VVILTEKQLDVTLHSTNRSAIQTGSSN